MQPVKHTEKYSMKKKLKKYDNKNIISNNPKRGSR